MLINLGVLEKVIEHQGSQDKLAAAGSGHAAVALFKLQIAPVTALRKANSANSWGLCFDDVDLASKIDRKTLAVKLPNYCAAVVQASATTATINDAAAAAAQLVDHELEFRGKDVVTIAGVGLRSKFGSLPAAATTEPVLTGQLHSSSALALAKSSWLATLITRLGL